jgi:hypothetical protein
MNGATLLRVAHEPVVREQWLIDTALAEFRRAESALMKQAQRFHYLLHHMRCILLVPMLGAEMDLERTSRPLHIPRQRVRSFYTQRAMVGLDHNMDIAD